MLKIRQFCHKLISFYAFDPDGQSFSQCDSSLTTVMLNANRYMLIAMIFIASVCNMYRVIRRYAFYISINYSKIVNILIVLYVYAYLFNSSSALESNMHSVITKHKIWYQKVGSKYKV